MTRETPTDDWLDAAIAADAADHRSSHIDDDGFTLRVVNTLPQALSLPAWRRRALAVLWAAAGVGLALALPGAFFDVAREVFRLVGGHAISLTGMATAFAAATLIMWGAAAFMLRSD